MQRRSTLLALVVALLGVVALWLFLVWQDGSFFWRNDYQLWYSPIFEETVRALRASEWPILTQGSWTTANLGGEFQAGSFSLWHLALLLGLWSLPLSMPSQAAALALVHLALTATGIVLLCRQRGWPAHVAAAVALTTTWSGWLISWGANQWFVALSGFSWLPWTWWALEAALSGTSFRRRWLVPGIFVYLLISEGSPFAVLMLGIVTAWFTLRAWASTRRLQAVGPIMVAWVLGLGLSAPAWWMLCELHGYSVRADWGTSVQWNWIVPWRAWLGLVLPGVEFPWRNFWQQETPIPAAVLLGGWVPLAGLTMSAIYALRGRSQPARPKSSLHTFLAHPSAAWGISLAVIMGALCSLPLVGSFRWSFRWLPLFHLALALAAAPALRRVPPRQVARAGAALLIIAAAIGYGAGVLGSPTFLAVQAGVAALWFLISHLPIRWARWCPVVVILISAGAAFSLLDLPRSSFAYTYPLTENLREPGPLEPERLYLAISSGQDQLAGFQAQPGWGAILRPGNTSLLAGLRFLNGYSSFTAFGVPEWFETFGNVKPEKAKVLLSPQADSLLGLLGVDGLVVGPEYLPLTDQLGPEWKEVVSSPEATLFHREPARAASLRVLPLDATKPPSLLPTARVVEERRLAVKVRIDSPIPSSLVGRAETPTAAVVTFNRPFLPGYKATLQGEKLPVKCYGGMMPMVLIPAFAQGELHLQFAPPSLRYGVPIAIGFAALTLLAWVVPRRSRSVGLQTETMRAPPST